MALFPNALAGIRTQQVLKEKAYCKQSIFFTSQCFVYKHIIDPVGFLLPWVPEVFLTCRGNLRCWPKAEAAGHYKDLTETGNRTRKVSGTPGSFLHNCC